MKITENSVILPKLREVNPQRASQEIGKRKEVSVSMPAPASACDLPNAAGRFNRIDPVAFHELMCASGLVASNLHLQKQGE